MKHLASLLLLLTTIVYGAEAQQPPVAEVRPAVAPVEKPAAATITVTTTGASAALVPAQPLSQAQPQPAQAQAQAQAQPQAPHDPHVHAIRIKDVADVLGVRENQLVGQGLVVGLDGTGDKSGTVTSQALANLVSRSGINVTAASVKPKNIAIVAITAQLPPFSHKGAKIDVQVSSMGDAQSLQGGILLQTPLTGADGRVYAVAQGALSIGGFSVNGGDAKIQKNHLLVGRIPNGALIEREVATDFQRGGIIKIILRQSDFTTAQRVSECINARWANSARAVDPYTIEYQLPNNTENIIPVAILAELESLKFTPDVRAKVAINERTGTIVAGANVKLSPTVLSHGGIVLSIKSSPIISQPQSFGQGATVVASDTQASITQEAGIPIVLEHGPTLADLAAALTALKVKPRDIIAIFQALKEAGALNADLVIM